ncbi:unnamed protein product [Strongylus vulgaris]|uniref:Uncharacterized protein n=1 Tax=Strongylus vulgaris TaxID=40348 RepID=A0A3P7LY12_STRVU|nr:unnamed protein product [Strongylus vulgaris]
MTTARCWSVADRLLTQHLMFKPDGCLSGRPPLQPQYDAAPVECRRINSTGRHNRHRPVAFEKMIWKVMKRSKSWRGISPLGYFWHWQKL